MTYTIPSPYGEFFLKQGRPDFLLKGCAILCVTTYKVNASTEKLQISTVTRSSPNLLPYNHAEKTTLNKIKRREQKKNW
jgi:hypothetical protein